MTPEEQEAERLRRLRALYEDYWLAADPERREELADEIRELALALKDENDAIRWLREADQLRTQALEEQRAKAEEAQKKPGASRSSAPSSRGWMRSLRRSVLTSRAPRSSSRSSPRGGPSSR